MTVPGEQPGAAKPPRESIQIQAMLAQIGSTMGHRIWLPANDKVAVLKECKGEKPAIADALPLNYDKTTLDTIERIDVLWLKGRSIIRAFEVEHSTAIYSGILRMADLLSLQPNMDIRLHIVAPEERKEKVFEEITRPVFSLLQGRPLFKRCTFLSYDSVREIAALEHLAHVGHDPRRLRGGSGIRSVTTSAWIIITARTATFGMRVIFGEPREGAEFARGARNGSGPGLAAAFEE